MNALHIIRLYKHKDCINKKKKEFFKIVMNYNVDTSIFCALILKNVMRKYNSEESSKLNVK